MWYFNFSIGFRVPFDIMATNVKWKHIKRKYFEWNPPLAFTWSHRSTIRIDRVLKEKKKFYFSKNSIHDTSVWLSQSRNRTNWIRSLFVCVFVMQNTLFQLICVLSTVHINPVLFSSFFLSFPLTVSLELGLPSFSHVSCSVRICERSNWIKLV